MEIAGSGTARLAIGGSIAVRGHGTFAYRDLAGDARVSVTGQGWPIGDGEGWTRYVGFSGSATLGGSSLEVVVAGGELAVSADGPGTVALAGSWAGALGDPTVAEAAPEQPERRRGGAAPPSSSRAGPPPRPA